MAGFLAALAKNTAKKEAQPISAIALINEHLLIGDQSEDRRDKMFHPSELAGAFCPRAWSLYNYHTDGYSVKEGSVDPRLSRIFGNGHGQHHRLQSYLLDNLWGTWRRVVGYNREDEVPLYEYHQGFRPKGPTWRYMEVRLEHGPDRILGSTDGLLRIGVEKWGLEIKGINTDSYRYLTAPKVIHRNQTLIYEYALEWMRQEKMKAATLVDDFDAKPISGFIVLYEDKNTQDLKEYPVPRDPQEVENFMVGRRLLMDEALEFERTGEHPACQCAPGKKTALCKAFPDPHQFSRMLNSQLGKS